MIIVLCLYLLGFDVSLQWMNKTPTRLPESIMYYFSPAQKKGLEWRLSKVGHLVDPGNVILNGSQYVHGKSTKNGQIYRLYMD